MATHTLAPSSVDRRSLRPHHVLALVASAGLSAIALYDAARHGLTGEYSVFSDDSGDLVAGIGSAVVHGLAYAALVLVLLREREVFVARRVTAVLRWVLAVAFGFLAVGFLVLSPIHALATGSTSTETATGAFAVLSGVVGTVGFVGMLIGSLVLALTQLRRATLGLGGRVLLTAWPVLLLTVGLMALGSDWAHPGYLETAVNVGIALSGVGLVAVAARD